LQDEGMSPCDDTILVERASAFPFDSTVERLTTAITAAGMTIFAVVDHALNAQEAGLTMLPSTVLLYGKAAGGTPIMLAAPRTALDLPLRVLVREDAEGQTLVCFHPIATALEALGAPAPLAARLAPTQALILETIRS
jgi:uncharacterized protein (DUF302 family)